MLTSAIEIDWGGGRDFKDIDVLLRFSSAHGIARIAQWMAGHPDVCLTVAFYGTSLRLQCSNRVAVRHAVVEDGHQWFMITIYYYWLAKDVDVKIVATPQYGKCFALCRSSWEYLCSVKDNDLLANAIIRISSTLWRWVRMSANPIELASKIISDRGLVGQ